MRGASLSLDALDASDFSIMPEPMRSPRCLPHRSWLWGLLIAVAGGCGGWVAESMSQQGSPTLTYHYSSELSYPVVAPDVFPNRQSSSHAWVLGMGAGSLAASAIALWQWTTSSPDSPPPDIPSLDVPSQALDDNATERSSARSTSPLNPPIDLRQLRSPDQTLSQKQRDVLQCLWVMAAIAPAHASTESSTAASTTAWEWVIEALNPSTPAFDSMCDLLTKMGFSRQTIRTARNIALEYQKLPH